MSLAMVLFSTFLIMLDGDLAHFLNGETGSPSSSNKLGSDSLEDSGCFTLTFFVF